MLNARSSCSRWSMIVLTLSLMGAYSVAALGQDLSEHVQEVPAVHVGYSAITGVPQDWSHHHVVFSNPGSEEGAIKSGRYSDWLRIVNDPRYVLQQMRRNAAVQGPLGSDVAFRQSVSKDIKLTTSEPQFAPLHGTPVGVVGERARRLKSGPQLKKDWNSTLTASAIMPNAYPAKYGFSTAGTPSCANDFVVYPTGATGTAGAATILAFNNIYPGATAPGCGSATAPETVYWAYNTTITASAPGAVTTSPVLSLDGTKVAYVQGTGTAANLIVLKATPATGHTVATPVSITAASSNMGCAAPCMTVTNLSHAAAGDTYSAPFYDYSNDTLFVGDSNGYLYKITPVFNSTTTAPVATSVELNTTTQSPVASPVYDSTSGCVFVGDTNGFLYSVNSSISGGSVCTSATFGVNKTSEQLGGAANEGIFDGPLVDSTAGRVYVFVTDSVAVGTRATTASPTSFNTAFTFTGTNFTAADVGSSITGTCITAGATVATVVPASHSGTLSVANTSGCGANEAVTLAAVPAGDEAVDQFPTNFGAAAAPSDEAALGTGGANYWVLAGTFDNTYYSSGTPATPSGNIYVVGNQGTSGGNNLYRVPITSNAVGTPVATTVNSTRHGWASPVQEFYNTATSVDDIYFSVNHASVGGACTAITGNGCIISYNVTSGVPVLAGTTNFTYPGTNGCWGTSAFIIDNGTTSTATANVYFMYFGGDSPSTAPTTCSPAAGANSAAISESQGTAF